MKASNRAFTVLAGNYYPPKEIRLLQQAAIAPLPKARDAWREWRDLDRLDVIDWQEQKILARLHVRIPELDPDYIHLPRLIGLTKSLWTKSASRLNASIAAVDLLLAHDLDIMLFKGIPFEKRFNAKGVRLYGDLDVLVREKDFLRALTLLQAHKWVTEGDTDWIRRGLIPAEIHGVNYCNAAGGNIDVHRRPSHSVPAAGYLERLWAKSEEAVYMGRRVRFCSHADYLALLVDHGVGKSPELHMSSIWPVDFHQAVSTQHSSLVRDFQLIIRQLRIPLQSTFALNYCTDILSSDNVRKFSSQLDTPDVSTADLARAVLNSPPAYTRGTLLWLIAGSIRRLSRYVQRASQYHFRLKSLRL